MRRHQNTLYVSTQGTYLAAEGESVVVKLDKEVRIRVPFHHLEGIVCFGRVSCSPQLMGRCAERDISISFLSQRGRFLARVQGPTSGNVLLRRCQYRTADDENQSSEIARSFVSAKIANCRAVIQRALRDYPESPGANQLREASKRLAEGISQLDHTTSLDSTRGIEGDAARTYFGVFNHLISQQLEWFTFTKRSRRPPMDPVNALLSFLYTLLVHDAGSALESVGLDPQVGFLHKDRPGRPGLALDLMEEFRPILGDRIVLSLINRRQVSASGFETRETGGVYMDDDTRKTILTAYQERKQEELRHPFLDEKVTIGMLLHLQARLLARRLRGDLDAYPPFFWR